MSVEEKVIPQTPEEKMTYSCPWFQDLLKDNPPFRRFSALLQREGFDTKETFPFLTVEYMAKFGMPSGVRRLFDDGKKNIATSSG